MMSPTDRLVVVEAGTCLFLTDVHIVDEQTERAALFLQALDFADKQNFECVVLMGDIFDFFFAATSYHHKKFSSIGTKLESLAAQGMKVFFIQGNHEFSLSHLKWGGVQVLINQPLIIKNGQRTIAVCHGDKFCPPLAYRIYLSVVSSKPFQLAVGMLPQKLLDRWCLSISATSRENDDLSSINHSGILGSATRWASRLDADVCVFGHFHVPYSVKTKQGMSLVSCHDWSSPNYLILENNQFERFYFATEAKKYLRLPLQKKLRI